MSEICVSKTHASSRHPCSRPCSPCRSPQVILDPSQPTKASPHPDLAYRQVCGSTIDLGVKTTPAKQHEERVIALILGRIKSNELHSYLQPKSVCDLDRLARRNVRHANCWSFGNVELVSRQIRHFFAPCIPPFTTAIQSCRNRPLNSQTTVVVKSLYPKPVLAWQNNSCATTAQSDWRYGQVGLVHHRTRV